MHRSRRGAGKGARFVGACMAVVAAMVLGESYANAQVSDDSMALPSTRVTLPESIQLQNAARGGGQPARFAVPGTSAGLGTTLRINLPRSPGSFDDADRVASQRTPVHGRGTSTAGGRRSTTNKTLNVVIAATAGLFLGGYPRRSHRRKPLPLRRPGYGGGHDRRADRSRGRRGRGREAVLTEGPRLSTPVPSARQWPTSVPRLDRLRSRRRSIGRTICASAAVGKSCQSPVSCATSSSSPGLCPTIITVSAFSPTVRRSERMSAGPAR